MRVADGLNRSYIYSCPAHAMILESLYDEAGIISKFPFKTSPPMIDYFRREWPTIFVKDFSKIILVMQTKGSLEVVASSYVNYRRQRGYDYLEIQIAPQYHARLTLSVVGATEIFCEQFRKLEQDSTMKILPIICIGDMMDIPDKEMFIMVVKKYRAQLLLDKNIQL